MKSHEAIEQNANLDELELILGDLFFKIDPREGAEEVLK